MCYRRAAELAIKALKTVMMWSLLSVVCAVAHASCDACCKRSAADEYHIGSYRQGGRPTQASVEGQLNLLQLVSKEASQGIQLNNMYVHWPWPHCRGHGQPRGFELYAAYGAAPTGEGISGSLLVVVGLQRYKTTS